MQVTLDPTKGENKPEYGTRYEPLSFGTDL